MDRESRLSDLSSRRTRFAAVLTAAMVVMYFGFILLIAFDKPLMGSLIVPGLSVGILLGALVIVASWIMTWIYVRWANTHYDKALAELHQ
jgi:uncharacterized membrane protein (DUF485 family)